MNKSLALKNKLYLFFSLLISFFIFLYLFYFLINGERGIISYYKIKNQNSQIDYNRIDNIAEQISVNNLTRPILTHTVIGYLPYWDTRLCTLVRLVIRGVILF